MCFSRCYKCDANFLSSLKLIDHLTSVHLESGGVGLSWEKMFEESINNSMFLPEPDKDIMNVEREKINLPSELSETAVTEQIKQVLYMSHDNFFPTMWHFDKFKLRRVCAASF